VETITETTSTCEILPMQGTVEMPELGTVTVFGALRSGTVCTASTDTSRAIEPVTTDAFMLPVALVDYAGE
jgi:hypothetical protein